MAQPAFCNAGDVNAFALDLPRNRLYATSRVSGLGTEGMLLTIALDELKASVKASKVINYDESKHLLIKADMPNGLVMSASRSSLVFTQTMKDQVIAVNLKTKRTRVLFRTGEDGWLDGLIYLKDHHLYVATDSKLGKLHFFKFTDEKVQSIKILNLEGNSTGLASLAISGDRMFITDMWKGSLISKAVQEITGSEALITYHSRVYNFSITELLNF